MPDYGKETVRFFEIDQPFCALTFGTAPCAAVLGTTGAHKCHQSRFTCQDPDNYDPGVLTLRFAEPQEGLLQHRDKYGPVIPSMISLKTTPAEINLASMDRSADPLGRRELVEVVFGDHLHSDHRVDKYRLERKSGAASIPAVPYEPYTRGTFWGKWIARNPYFTNYHCRVREGFLGQELDEMRVRHYLISTIEGPADGQVQLTAKDLFSVIEAKKAMAPVASQGELLADISAVAGSATLTPAGIGDEEYPASGHLRIGDESIAFTRIADVLTLTTRGALGSAAAEHKAEDLVQLVLTYETEVVGDIIYDLLVTYSAIPAASIPKATWDVLTVGLTELYTTHITEPTPVLQLIGELCEQAGVTVWPDVSTGEVPLAVLRPSASTVTVDDNAWIVDGSLSIKRQDQKRVSRVAVHYGLINPNEDLNDERNYHSRYITPDLQAEGPQQYGVMAIRKVFSRWIPQFGRQLAQSVGERILAIYRDPPREARFRLHASRNGELELARPFTLRVAEIQDALGAMRDLVMLPIKLERGLDEIDGTAQQMNFSGGGSSPLGGNDRTIFIENDILNVNMRTVHDSIYAPPTGVEAVTFIVEAGFTVGSSSTSTSAMRTGSWPAGVTLNLIVFGRIQGKAGRGGGGDGTTAAGVLVVGSVGENGGIALTVEAAITIDNASGQIWGGGGGGGGGGFDVGPGFSAMGGGGGGGGSGTEFGVAGLGGPTGPGDAAAQPGQDGQPGTRDAAGSGGPPGSGTSAGFGGFASGGLGGDGGPPGQPGSAGANGVGLFPSPGYSGGAPGKYIDGIALVTWIGVGDVRGPVA